MPRSGYIKRQYPRVEVLRGFNPNEPQTFTQAYPVKAQEVILSGQVISAGWNAANLQYEWEKGWQASRTPYIALNDATDEDVLEAGNLVALSCLGKFEIETAFFDDQDTYNEGVPVSPDGTSGDLKVATGGNGIPILGYVTRIRGPKSLVGLNSNVVNTEVICFSTAYDANPA